MDDRPSHNTPEGSSRRRVSGWDHLLFVVAAFVVIVGLYALANETLLQPYVPKFSPLGLKLTWMDPRGVVCLWFVSLLFFAYVLLAPPRGWLFASGILACWAGGPVGFAGFGVFSIHVFVALIVALVIRRLFPSVQLFRRPDQSTPS